MLTDSATIADLLEERGRAELTTLCTERVLVAGDEFASFPQAVLREVCAAMPIIRYRRASVYFDRVTLIHSWWSFGREFFFFTTLTGPGNDR